jgi:protein tyrosine/serine phosphatase
LTFAGRIFSIKEVMKKVSVVRKADLFALALAAAAVCLYARAARPQMSAQSQQGAAAGESPGCMMSTAAGRLAEKLDLQGVPNFGRVTATLYRGGQPSKDGFDELKKLGVRIVVNLRDDNSETERSVVTTAGLEYVAIPWNCRHPANSLAARFLQVLRANREKKVFVHCHAGVDRTGLMIAAYRMAEHGWTPEQATDEMKDFGFNFIHRSWCHALVDYEEDFPQQLAADPDLRPLRAAQPTLSPCTP